MFTTAAEMRTEHCVSLLISTGPFTDWPPSGISLHNARITGVHSHGHRNMWELGAPHPQVSSHGVGKQLLSHLLALDYLFYFLCVFYGLASSLYMTHMETQLPFYF